jgi:hypothetical protein
VRSPLPVPFRIILAAFSLGMVALFCGVGGYDSSLISVAGTVSLDGKPLESGTIRFICLSETQQLHVDVSLVQDGQYAISGSESLVPGTYQIQVRSYAQEADPKAIKPNADKIPPSQRILVPARYNLQSILQVKIQHGGLSRFDFDLKN